MYNMGGMYCGNPQCVLFPGAREMQAVETFLSAFQSVPPILVHISMDNLLEDSMTLGMLSANIANYVPVGGNRQNFSHAYRFEPVRLVIVVDGMNIEPNVYQTIAQTYPGIVYIPTRASVYRMMNDFSLKSCQKRNSSIPFSGRPTPTLP
jgi:hypothetical protein